MINVTLIIVIIAFFVIAGAFVSVQQGTIAVVTIFGKYSRLLRPGLNFRVPFIELIYKRISIQNRSVELEFQAITNDQANVHFKAMLLFAVVDQEGSIRSFVATKRQSEILSLRKEIIDDVKLHLDTTLETWGYHLIDLQLNDISFDQEVTKSMAKVVASQNLLAAAENEGQALLITKTKAAEAEGNSIKIAATCYFLRR